MTKPSDLVSIDEGVRGDPTMEQWHQLLRVDLVRGAQVKAQVMLSRIHREDPKNRRNQYISYSLPTDLFKLGLQFLAAAMTLMYYGDPSVILSHAVKWQMKGQDKELIKLIQLYMEGLK